MATTIGTSGDIYKYSIEAKILLNGGKEIEQITENNIQYLYIEYDYYKYNMPMIFASFTLDKNVIDKMITYIGNSVINLTIYKYIDNVNPKIKAKYIEEQFAYFMGKDFNNNKSMDYESTENSKTGVLSSITLGMLKIDHINNNKKKFSGVLKNSSLTNAIYYCCSGLPLLLEPIKHEKNISQLILPPMSGVSKEIAYLNNNFNAFYDSPYRFYMDFETTYLISSDGKPVPKKGDKINSVVINIQPITKGASCSQGLITNTKNKIYEVNVSQNDAYVVDDTTSEKAVNSLTSVTYNGTTSTLDLKNNRSSYINSKEEIVRIPNNNTDLLKNKQYEMEMSNTTVELTKNDIDSSVFTINNEYSIKAADVYSGRDGKYILTKKREVFVRDKDSMLLSALLTFKKVPG